MSVPGDDKSCVLPIRHHGQLVCYIKPGRNDLKYISSPFFRARFESFVCFYHLTGTLPVCVSLSLKTNPHKEFTSCTSGIKTFYPVKSEFIHSTNITQLLLLVISFILDGHECENQSLYDHSSSFSVQDETKGRT